MLFLLVKQQVSLVVPGMEESRGFMWVDECQITFDSSKINLSGNQFMFLNYYNRNIIKTDVETK